MLSSAVYVTHFEYCAKTKAYCFLDIRTDKIIISRDVKFLEQNSFSAGKGNEENETIVYFQSSELMKLRLW